MMSKSKRYKIEARLKDNTISQLRIICELIKQVWKVFEAKYFENDYYRNKILTEILTIGRVPEDEENNDDEDEN
jgi:hypothetical protein